MYTTPGSPSEAKIVFQTEMHPTAGQLGQAGSALRWGQLLHLPLLAGQDGGKHGAHADRPPPTVSLGAYQWSVTKSTS